MASFSMTNFKISIYMRDKTVFEGEGWSVFLPGDSGEFEIMAFHKSIMSLLKEGKVIVDQEKEFPVKKGIVRFHNEELVVLAEG